MRNRRNANKPPRNPVFSNPSLQAGVEKEYQVPSCPECDGPTYSEPECLFCGQPFIEEDGRNKD